MIKDVGRLMQGAGTDLLWVIGNSSSCAEIHYLTGGVPLTYAWIILRPGEENPLLCHGPMEREAAAQSGCRTLDFGSLGADKLSQLHNDPLEVRLGLFERLAKQEDLSGHMAVHGQMDPGQAHLLLRRIEERLPGIEVIRDTPPVLEMARLTKDSEEISRMKEIARLSLEAYEAGLDVIRSGHLDGERLVDDHGETITIGRVKEAIRLALARRGLQETHETILSIGREAGIPHALSAPGTPLSAGRTIVLDLFPQEKGGGYFFDFTRTFFIGHAPDEALKLYHEVCQTQQKAIETIRAGLEGWRLQELVCEHFEALGHPTLRTRPGTTEGYVHSLGHGVGLEVHEHPYLKLQDIPDERSRLQPGTVFTV
ncbi:MAG: M24 family metallopeptidase, partial [Gemmatimonadota bacterium]|nr:M24 family metallopeptidase [Gemmatimonadota bacterium]